MGRYTDENNFYVLRLAKSGHVQLYKKIGGVSTLLQQSTQSVVKNVPYTLKLTIKDTMITGYVNGVQKISTTDSSLTAGKIGVRATNQSMNVDDVTVTAE
jgi:hypothetical protein